MPVWNIPLIWRIFRRKASGDISLGWLFGVWICMLLMLPSAWMATNIQLRGYAFSNIIFFTMVVVVVLMYRKNDKNLKNLSSPKNAASKEPLK